METPLKIKWLGEEMEEVCDLLSPFNPLILISPTPTLRTVLPGLINLPGSVSNLWDLHRTDWTLPPRPAAKTQKDSPELRFDYVELEYGPQDFSAIYEFYFQVYLRNTAVRHWEGSFPYRHVEALHQALFEGTFVALIRASHNDEVVAGCLLRRPSAEEMRNYRQTLGSHAPGHEVEGVTLDLMCPDVRFEHYGIDNLLILHAGRWARESGYCFLSTTPAPALTMNPRPDNPLWACGAETIPVFHQEHTDLLYCDMRRCSYLRQDFFFYAGDGATKRLHYIANELTRGSQQSRLLDSVTGIEKRAYTRHAALYKTLSEAGIACELVEVSKARGGRQVPGARVAEHFECSWRDSSCNG